MVGAYDSANPIAGKIAFAIHQLRLHLSKGFMVRNLFLFWTSRKGPLSVTAALVCFCLPLSAQVQLPSLFADHMVVQRNMPVHVWGTAAPGEAITVTFAGKSGQTTTNRLGRWSVYLPPVQAGGPFTLQVQGTNTITLSDVLAGDVWIASGQSNMEFTMGPGDYTGVLDAPKELAMANHPEIRLLHLANRSSDMPVSNPVIKQSWTSCTPESVAQFSAVAYYFARDLQQSEKVPIGIIEAAWGGTPAEAWTSLEALSADPSLMPVFIQRARMLHDEPTVRLERPIAQREYDAAKAAGKNPAPLPWHPDLASWMPGGLFNAMIAPLTPFPIKGVIWYQAESNASAEMVSFYARLFETLIQDWRNRWGQRDFPFLYAQIASWSPGTLWPEMREQQQKALVLRNTAMAVTLDNTGNLDDIHPRDKQPVGMRLALAARAVAYGEFVEYSGPALRQVTTEPHALRVWFDHAHGGLVSKNGNLRGFEIADADQKFVPAQANLSGNTILLSASSVADPVWVRYDWAPSPNGNLYNGDGLPASPFRAKAYDGE